MTVTVRLNHPALDALLRSPGGEVGRMIGRAGDRMESEAKREAPVSGPPNQPYRPLALYRRPYARYRPEGGRPGRLRDAVSQRSRYPREGPSVIVWVDTRKAPYAKFVIGGTAGANARPGSRMVFWQNGADVYAKHVAGQSPNNFVGRAFATVWPTII